MDCPYFTYFQGSHGEGLTVKHCAESREAVGGDTVLEQGTTGLLGSWSGKLAGKACHCSVVWLDRKVLGTGV